jgi:hypothetical protein
MGGLLKAIANGAALCLLYSIRGVYRMFFGWWLDGLLDAHSEKQLKNRARQIFSFLFDQFQARFVPSDLGYEWTKGRMITLEVANVRLRLSRDRGDDFADIAPLHDPSDWEPLTYALMAVLAQKPIRSKDDLPRQVVFPEWGDLVVWMKPHFSEINEAYSVENYSGTKMTIQQIASLPGLGKSGRLVRTGVGGTGQKSIQTLNL